MHTDTKYIHHFAAVALMWSTIYIKNKQMWLIGSVILPLAFTPKQKQTPESAGWSMQLNLFYSLQGRQSTNKY